MPYCCHCGSRVEETASYCAHCGARQPQTSPGLAGSSLTGISPRAAATLCYIPIVGWIPAIVVLASTRFRDNREVRFHAFQGLYLFVTWLLVDWVIAPLLHLPGGHVYRVLPVAGLLKGLIFAVWIFMLIKTNQDQLYRLPILGELAERSLSEQK